MSETNLFVIFMTGLITGGLTCLAVQGGLLASAIAEREQERLVEGVKKGNAKPILFFLAAKLAAYTLLGFLLGWFGSFFQLSVGAQVVLQCVVAIFMIGTALNLLNAHPFFRYFVIQPPKFLTRLVRKQSKSKDTFAPVLLGAFTVFIPCGTTQAMMALAVASGSAVYGAAILFAFILGTSPLFFLLGYFTTKLGDAYQKKFFKVAAVAIILLALFNLRGALALSGVVTNISSGSQSQMSPIVSTEPVIEIGLNGYTPNSISVPAGAAIKLHLKNVASYSCAQSFIIPKLGIQKVVPPGEEYIVEFVAPNRPGKIAFSCSMGMYRGVINVI